MRLSAMEPVSRRAVAMSRVVLGLYAGVAVAGTHWPRLQIGDPNHPVDKMLHFVAFGGLAFFLSRGRYFRSTWALLLFACAWIVLDEVTQALPGLGRSFSVEDMLAGWLGAGSTALMLWATRPLRLPIARLRRERFDAVVDLVLSEPSRFMALVASAAAGVTIGMPTSIILNGLSETPTPVQAGIIGLVLGGLAASFVYVILAVRAMEERMMERTLCLGCGQTVGGEAGPCTACGRTPLMGQWFPMPGLAASAIVRACIPPVLGGLGTILFAIIAIQLSAGVVGTSEPVLRLNEWLRGPARGMEANFHIVLLVIVAALTVDRCRNRVAVRLECGSRTCLGCGHDLRATSAPKGVGRCGECGAGFVRVEAGNP